MLNNQTGNVNQEIIRSTDTAKLPLMIRFAMGNRRASTFIPRASQTGMIADQRLAPSTIAIAAITGSAPIDTIVTTIKIVATDECINTVRIAPIINAVK